MVEDWEKDFSGLEKLRTIKAVKLMGYLNASDEVGLRLEFKSISRDEYEIWTPKGRDLTEFWEELKLHGN